MDDGVGEESEDSLEKLIDAKRRCGGCSSAARSPHCESSSSDSVATAAAADADAKAELWRAPPGETVRRQLLAYMKRVEDVLGRGWELYAEGQKLQAESAAFRRSSLLPFISRIS